MAWNVILREKIVQDYRQLIVYSYTIATVSRQSQDLRQLYGLDIDRRYSQSVTLKSNKIPWTILLYEHDSIYFDTRQWMGSTKWQISRVRVPDKYAENQPSVVYRRIDASDQFESVRQSEEIHGIYIRDKNSDCSPHLYLFMYIQKEFD